MVTIEPTSDDMGRYIQERVRDRLEYDGREVASRYKESYSKRDLRIIYINPRRRIPQTVLATISRCLLAYLGIDAILVAMHTDPCPIHPPLRPSAFAQPSLIGLAGGEVMGIYYSYSLRFRTHLFLLV